jgi:hypothetical protein
MSDLVFQFEGWPYQPHKCPSDVDFVDWAEKYDLQGSRIFHMGPGNHHLVGERLGERNTVISATISVEEMRWFTDLIQLKPHLMHKYQCLFLDIHAWNSMMMPDFDIFTLFHFGEMVDSRREKYAIADLHDALERILDSRSGSGAMVFGYDGSSAADRSYPVFREMLGSPAFQHNSLSGWELS